MAAAGHADASRWLHYGLTSNDVVDTAQALHGTQRLEIDSAMASTISPPTLKTRAFEFKDTVQIGRTHGIHAEPITFGLKLALWYDEMQRNLTRFSAAAEGMRVGKISGAVGNLRPYRSAGRRAHLPATGIAAGADRVASDLARPPCRTMSPRWR